MKFKSHAKVTTYVSEASNYPASSLFVLPLIQVNLLVAFCGDATSMDPSGDFKASLSLAPPSSSSAAAPSTAVLSPSLVSEPEWLILESAIPCRIIHRFTVFARS